MPRTATVVSGEFWLRAFGVNDVTAGAALTVNAPGRVTAGAPSGLVTVTSRVPGVAAPETVTTTAREVGPDRVTELTVTPAPKLTVELAHVPGTKLSPVTVIVWFVVPCARDVGLIDDTVAAAFTVNAPVPVTAGPPLLLLTVTSHAPGVASADTARLFNVRDVPLPATEPTVTDRCCPSSRTSPLHH